MPPGRHVEVAVERLSDDPELGLWCTGCALPSGVGVSFLLVINSAPYGIARRGVCLECGEETDG
jgi:hypothetical protein